MNILKPNYDWAYALTNRGTTTHLVLHHAAGDGSPEAIHAYHKSLGWAGIAYHFYIRKDGSVYAGRPIDKTGGHTTNWNWCSLGICFEGNFEIEEMGEAQIKAGAELVDYIRGLYPGIAIGKHKDFQATACPGRNFPYDEIVAGLESGGEPGNTDVEETDEAPSWAAEAWQRAIDSGLILGDGAGKYHPNAYVTRAELILILERFRAMEG